MKVLILAGGFATRLWPLTESRAKPLLLLDGKTILAHILEKIPETTETILLTNKKFVQDFETEIKKLNRKNVNIFCEDSQSDGEKVGALGAVSLAIKEFNIQENIIILAGDNLLPDLKIEQLYCKPNQTKIAVREVADFHEARKFGVVEVDDPSSTEMKAVNFEEKPQKPKSKLVSTGFSSIGSELFPILHNFAKKHPDALGAIFAKFLKENKTVLAEKITGEWFDIGSFETYLEAHKKLQKENIKTSPNVIEKENTLSGKVFIGENCHIENCRIYNSIIYPNTTLKDCHISETIIDKNCHFEGIDLNRKLIRKNTKIISEI